MAEETDPRKVQFSQLYKLRGLYLDMDRVEVILIKVYLDTKLCRNRKNVLWTYGRTDGHNRLQ